MNTASRRPPALAIVGRSGSGKTTLIERLLPELKRRGYRVGTVKHHSHPGFEMDVEGKDTWRFAQAGSDHVVLAAPDKMASIRLLAEDMAVEAILETVVQDVDVALVEGYRWSSLPKLEIVRAARSRDLLCAPEELMALVTDADLDPGLPRFGLDDTAALADWVETAVIRPAAPGQNPGSQRRKVQDMQG